MIDDRKDLHFLPEGYELDTFTTHRNNKDVPLNSYGEQLIQICIASKLRVLNGRTRGNLQGHYIYLGYQGCSTVDLFLASENIFQTNLIQYLSVQTFTTFQTIGLYYLRFYGNILAALMRQQPQTAQQKINRKGLYGRISQKNCTLKHQKKNCVASNGRTLMNYK